MKTKNEMKLLISEYVKTIELKDEDVVFLLKYKGCSIEFDFLEFKVLKKGNPELKWFKSNIEEFHDEELESYFNMLQEEKINELIARF